jgi:hypothetical protein
MEETTEIQTIKKQINFDNFKCRCSAIHMAMADSRDNPTLTEKQTVRLAELEAKETLTETMKAELAKLLVNKANATKVVLSATYIGYLMAEYAWVTQGMVSVTRELMDIPQMQKGCIVEPESLALLSIVDGKYYFPNEDEKGNRERIYNEYLSGEVDAYEGETIMTANAIPDVKSIWDYPTFLNKIHEPLTKANDLQIKGYLDISKAPVGFIANCLIDTPEEIINGIKYKLLNKTKSATEDDPKFKEKWVIIERSMRFGHIAPHLRVFKKNVEPMTSTEQSALYDRVKIGREWLNNFHEAYQKLNK